MKKLLIAGFVALVAFVAIGAGLSTDTDTASADIGCSQDDDDAAFCLERGVNAWLEGDPQAPSCAGCTKVEVYVTYECEWGLCRGPGYFWLPPEPPPVSALPSYHSTLIAQSRVYIRPESGAPYPLFVFTDNGDGNVPGPGNSNPYYQSSTVSQYLADGSDGPECSWLRRSPPDDQMLVLRQHGASAPCLTFTLWGDTITIDPDDSEVRSDGTVVFGCVSACPSRQASAQTNSVPPPGNGAGGQQVSLDGGTGGGAGTNAASRGEPEAISGFLVRLCEWASEQGMEPKGCG